MNDCVSEAHCLLSYVSITNTVKTIIEKGLGARLAKIDVCNAYCALPVHPENRWLLGMHWEDALYVDCTLPFGLWSAPKMFMGVADAVECIAKREGVDSVLH